MKKFAAGGFFLALIMMTGMTANATTSSVSFNTNLYYGMTGNVVVASLQQFLAAQGVYAGPITGNFFSLTLQGVKKFQMENNISPISGYFGPLSRAKANEILLSENEPTGVASTSPPPVTQPPTSTPPPAPIPAVINTPPTNPTTTQSTLLWGAYAGDSLTSLADFEAVVGQQVNIQAMFDDWSSDFPSQYLATVGQTGKTLLVFWEPSFGYDTINSGNEDSYISRFASEAKAYGYPVILVPFAEMNLNEAPWGDPTGNSNSAAKDNTPAKAIQAWQHVYNLFAVAGATNVKFAWDVNSTSQPNIAANSIASYYPGSAYVNYVGVDGFNFGDPTQSFATIFDNPITQLETYNKPIYIFSMGSYEYSGKAAWITAGLGTHIKTYPNIAGWIWFNQDDANVPSAGDNIDWMANSDPAALAAFKAVIP